MEEGKFPLLLSTFYLSLSRHQKSYRNHWVIFPCVFSMNAQNLLDEI